MVGDLLKYKYIAYVCVLAGPAGWAGEVDGSTKHQNLQL